MTTNHPQKTLAYLRDHQNSMVAFLARLVVFESPTDSKPSLDRLASFLGGQLVDLGARVEVLAQAKAGNHVRARWGRGPGGILLLCHMDTVWDLGTVAKRPVHIEDGRLYGPGAFDMKGGITNALWAVRALRELNLFPARPVTLLLTSDEETGSKTSRPIIEEEAKRHDIVFVLEPAQPPHGDYKTWRKGVGGYQVTARGRAAHAGAHHERGVNAIEELAHQILTIQGFTDYEAGTTVNVGLIRGGTRRNVVPAEAQVQVDARVMDEVQAARLEAHMKGLKPRLPGASLEVSGGIARPPMVRTPKVVALFARARDLAAEMGLALDEAGSGGGSDGNYTAALGVPTLDGMGVVGDGGHALDEHVIITSLPERAAILAAMLHDLDGDEP